MLKIKNLHLIWITTLLSTGTVLCCLAFLFTEKSNATVITGVSKDLEAATNRLSSDISLIRNELQSIRQDIGALRVDLSRVDKGLDVMSATLNRKPWESEMHALRKQVEENESLKEQVNELVKLLKKKE